MSRRLIAIAALVGLMAACAPPEAPEGALPVGMRTAPVPPVGANAYVYVRPTGNAIFASESLGVSGLTFESADILLAEDSDGVAVRFTATSHVATQEPLSEANGWTDADATGLRSGPDSPWGVEVRSAWAQHTTESFSTHFPAIWEDLQAMPASPPSSPIAAGFVRNFGSLLEDLIGTTGVTVPNLADGLALVRINRIAFVAYADDLTHLQEDVGPTLLRDNGVSILAVADSTYPSAVVGQVFDGFVTSLGLSPVGIAGATAYQRELTPDIHVVVLRDGPTLYFAIAPALVDANALIQTVVEARDAG